VVVKAQVHAGGRGKAGGIKLVASPDAAEEAAASMLGANLVTHQTSPAGVPVERVLVAEGTDIAKELYLGIVVDGEAGTPVVMASEAGGVEIEEVAAATPEKILRVAADPVYGLWPYQARDLAIELGIPASQVRSAADLVTRLYRVFVDNDCMLAEINPLAVAADGRLVAIDAKLTIDDDALFRHADLARLADPAQEDVLERKAHEAGLSYVKLEDGAVGCMVNGAGLAMATMDITRAAGTNPANFLDVGGGAQEEKIATAFEIIVSDPHVRAVLVNIFGGILRCDIAARGVVAGARQSSSTQPIVALLRGTNAEEGRQVLGEAPLNVTFLDELSEAPAALASVLGRTDSA
jgi:succinyl-CoA synthetase beta subunit